MMALRDHWNTTFIEFKESLNLIGWLPHEVVYEIQNALVHLLNIIQTQGFDNRRKEWKRAIAHLRRAHLDLLKICLFKIYEQLKNAVKTSEGCDTYLRFQKEFSQARLKELQAFGDKEIYKTYRNIIQQFMPITPKQKFPIPETRLASTSKNYFLIENYAHLLWEWAQLETLQTSLMGQKYYETSYRMVEAYLKKEDFSKDLKEYITILQVNITLLAIDDDCCNTLQNIPHITETVKNFMANRDKLKSKDTLAPKDIQQLYTDLSNQVTEIFPYILKWLGASIKPLDLKVEF